MRCLTLAGELRRRGYKITFAMSQESGLTVPRLADASVELLDPDAFDEDMGYEGQPDRSFDLAIVDHYALAAPFETCLRGLCDAILVIDDLANRPHDCDFLLDQTFGRDAEAYKRLVPPAADIMVGARYALLRPEFAAARSRAMQRRRATGDVERILISLGMTDLGGVTAIALKAVLDAKTGAAIDVVLGSRARSLDAVNDLARRCNRVAVHLDPNDLVSLMVDADLAVGAAGGSTWERCCLGLPTIMLVLAPNQQLIAQGMAELEVGAIADPDNLTDVVRQCATDVEWRGRSAAASFALVDGIGAPRVADRLTHDRQTAEARALDVRSLRLRPASDDDMIDIWLWRNDPQTRAQSKSFRAVPFEAHETWFRRASRSPESPFYVAELAGIPVAMVRFDVPPDRPDARLVSINLDPDRRGAGMAKPILAAACRAAFETLGPRTLIAEIAKDNVASGRAFESLGFRMQSAPSAGRFDVFERSPAPFVPLNVSSGM